MRKVTSAGIAFEVDGPPGATAIVLVHAGIADRRMWDPIWPALTAARRTLRLDLRGFGESTTRPSGLVDHAADLLATLSNGGIERAHLVGVSMGAGVVVAAALAKPLLAASLVLVAPGGSLFEAPTEDLRSLWRAEGEALDRGDVDGAVEANLRTWVDGPRRPPGSADPELRKRVGDMQRRAFEITAGWSDLEEVEPDPPIVARLGELTAPTLVLIGDRDVDAVRSAADGIVARVPGAQLLRWADVAHLPPLERPSAFEALLTAWMREVEQD